jgi:class 3 adenylate cyclase
VFRGREVKTTGDGFVVLFDTPARAVQCAAAMQRSLRDVDLRVRVGLHTGECDVSDGDVSGIAVHAAARIQAAASPGEILVSQTVRDLTAGSGLVYEDAGDHELKGLTDPWRLFSVRA